MTRFTAALAALSLLSLSRLAVCTAESSTASALPPPRWRPTTWRASRPAPASRPMPIGASRHSVVRWSRFGTSVRRPRRDGLPRSRAWPMPCWADGLPLWQPGADRRNFATGPAGTPALLRATNSSGGGASERSSRAECREKRLHRDRHRAVLHTIIEVLGNHGGPESRPEPRAATKRSTTAERGGGGGCDERGRGCDARLVLSVFPRLMVGRIGSAEIAVPLACRGSGR